VRPDRAIVVGDRIVAAFANGDRAYAPAAEQVLKPQPTRLAFLAMPPREKDMACLRDVRTAH
jgi:hypothetical protein